MRRAADYGVAPDRELGQNFLADANILDVIGRLSELERDDVALEVGGGLGVLSEYLAERVAHVHVVEIDGRLEPVLREALSRFGNVTLHIADALRLDLGSLTPAPGKLVANLPYGVAATLLLESIPRLPSLRLWVAMVQREVAERFAAAPGGRAYGIPSVLSQLACEVRVARTVSRNVFRPVPNVDSALLVMRRRDPRPAPRAQGSPAGPDIAALVRGAFAHRRKPLASSVALAEGAGAARREQIAGELERLGLVRDVRAERLTPAQFAQLAGALA